MKDIRQDDLTEDERMLYIELFGDEEELDEEDEESENHHIGRGLAILTVVLCVLVCVGLYAYYATRSYRDYELKEVVIRNDDERIGYINFGNNLFSYSRDGASYSDYNDTLLWSESFDMENPVADMCGKYLLLYDKQRTQTILFTTSGVANTQVMSLPVVSASVSETGRIAVLMQEKDTGYLQVFEQDGSLVASGELHMKNTGYPIAMDLSDSGEKMLVSVLNLNDGDIKTTLSFYDFSESGGKADNRIVANFSYAEMVVPRVVFGEGDKAVAFGDDELIFFTGAAKPKVNQEVFIGTQIKSIFFNEKYVGIITMAEGDSESMDNQLHLYTMAGQEQFETSVHGSYTSCKINDNNEVVLSDRQNINLYTKYGIHKFSYKSEEMIYEILPWDGTTNYYLIKKKATEKIRLR